ncbi:MAG TPA: pyridoxamine 5'-phosphate oxidase family protein [Actinomycetota bacterium]|nr:pyridoxamine 5'-phosphate oxidase family protein [Actinomycetota bacterium]
MDPRPEQDIRFGDPDAPPTRWEEALHVLETAELFWISTVRGDRRPHVTPLPAVWFEDQLHFCTGPDEQKAVNIAGNPRVVLTTGCNLWKEGLDLVVEGSAVRINDETRLRTLADLWRRKYHGDWDFSVRDGMFRHEDGGSAIVFALAPAKVIAFAKGPFAQTRFRFNVPG